MTDFLSMTGSPSIDNSQIFNGTRFQRMACGDLGGFCELADEYFADVHVRLENWHDFLAKDDMSRLAEEFHRCKGGAAMFGLERLYSLLGSWERDPKVGQNPVDLERFVAELRAAEDAVADFRANHPDV